MHSDSKHGLLQQILQDRDADCEGGRRLAISRTLTVGAHSKPLAGDCAQAASELEENQQIGLQREGDPIARCHGFFQTDNLGRNPDIACGKDDDGGG